MTKIFRTLCTECVLAWVVALYSSAIVGQSSVAATDAPAGFDNLTNGFVDQTSFDTAQAIDDGAEESAGGVSEFAVGDRRRSVGETFLVSAFRRTMARSG